MPKRRPAIDPATEKDAREYFGNDLPSRVPDTRWERGKSGNPAGRPKAPDTITDLLSHRLRRYKTDLADKLIMMALAGNLEAIKYIYDRLEGKPRQSIETKTTEESPLMLVLRRLDDDRKALEGRESPLAPATRQLGPVDAAQVREASG